MSYKIYKALFLALAVILIACSHSGKTRRAIQNTQLNEGEPYGERQSISKNNDGNARQLENQTFTARVVRIIDGDTMEILYDNQLLKIRLAHIDCPEKKGAQPYSSAAKKALSALCFDQHVTIYGGKVDGYGRLLAVVINSKTEILNQELLKRGLAWHFVKYSKDETYAALEAEARMHKLGLWQDENPIAPWVWRKIKKAL